ncbi:MAG: hypothetical protein ACPHUF_06255, partial [Gammaproteobacteria bacterium]
WCPDIYLQSFGENDIIPLPRCIGGWRFCAVICSQCARIVEVRVHCGGLLGAPTGEQNSGNASASDFRQDRDERAYRGAIIHVSHA